MFSFVCFLGCASWSQCSAGQEQKFPSQSNYIQINPWGFLSRIFTLKCKYSHNSIWIINLELRQHCIPVMTVKGKSVDIELTRGVMTDHIKCKIREWKTPLNHAFRFSQVRELRKYSGLAVTIEKADGHNAIKSHSDKIIQGNPHEILDWKLQFNPTFPYMVCLNKLYYFLEKKIKERSGISWSMPANVLTKYIKKKKTSAHL